MLSNFKMDLELQMLLCLKLENLKVEFEKPIRVLTQHIGCTSNAEDMGAFGSILFGPVGVAPWLKPGGHCLIL